MKLKLTAKDSTSELSSVIKVIAASPRISNILQFNITRPASTVRPPNPPGPDEPDEPTGNIDDARLTASLDIVASDYSEDRVYYIKYDLTLTVNITGINVDNSSQSSSTSVLCTTADQNVTIGVSPWTFEFNGEEYSTSNIRIGSAYTDEDSTNTWYEGGSLIPSINFTDNTGGGVTAGYVIGSGYWDATATMKVTCYAPNLNREEPASIPTLSDTESNEVNEESE